MKKSKNGFSLIELIVVITLIGILTLGAININFNSLIDKQNSLMFSNEVFSSIELIRNNSLLGKGISNGTSIIHPNKWIINIGTGGTNGTITGFYLTGGTLQNYNDLKVNFINSHYKINKLTCYDINKTNSGVINNLDIEFAGSLLTLSGCTSQNHKILDIETKYKNFGKIIRINTVNGVVEKVDN